MPSLPDLLLPLVKTSYRDFTDCPGYWEQPKEITPAASEAVRGYLAEMRSACPPVSAELLRGRIATLLSHYFTATKNENINGMIAMDWIESLSPFPQIAIESAIRHWRDNDSRKPKPADIRKLAVRAFGEVAWERYERAQMLSHLPVVDRSRMRPEKPPEEEWQRPTADKIAAVKELLSRAGLSNVSRETKA